MGKFGFAFTLFLAGITSAARAQECPPALMIEYKNTGRECWSTDLSHTMVRLDPLQQNAASDKKTNETAKSPAVGQSPAPAGPQIAAAPRPARKAVVPDPGPVKWVDPDPPAVAAPAQPVVVAPAIPQISLDQPVPLLAAPAVKGDRLDAPISPEPAYVGPWLPELPPL